MADDSSDLSSLSSLSPVPSDIDSEPEPEPQAKKGTILKFFNKLPKGQKAAKAAKEASPPPRKRSPSPAHEYVFADNPDIAFIVMFRSRFNEVFPKSLSNFGPQELETDITDSPPGQRVENFLCALLGLLLNRKQDVKPGHYMRALEDALSSHKHRWPKEWDDKSPLSGGISFNDMGNTQRLTLLRALIHWALSDSEAIKAMIAKAYKQNRHEDDRNQALSVQPWGSDSDKRRYFLVEGLDDTAFRVYRESNPAGFNRTWWSVAGSIEELTALATKLEVKDGGPKARKLAQNMMAAIPRFEATEEKRKRREYRQAQKNRFKRPSPGFSLYEGRTRGKRVKYTYSDDDDESWTDSTRRSTRNTGTHTPADPAGPVLTASGRQVRAPTRLEAQTRGSTDPGSVQGDESELSQAPEDLSISGTGRPRRSAAVNHGTNGWANAGRGRGSSADEMDDSDPDGGDGDDGDDHVPDETDEEDDVLNDEEMMVDDDLDERPAQLIVDLNQWGGDVECSRPIQLQPGGSAVNTATHLANLGIRNPQHELHVTLHTAVGNDSFAGVLKAHLAERNVILSSPTLADAPTGVCIVLSGVNDRSFITHYGAARKFSVEHIDDKMVLSADHLHIGGFYSCASLRAKLKPLLEKARENGITTSLDTNYDSSEKWDDLDELFPLIDVFLPNEVEAMKISHTDSVDAAMAYFAERVNGVTVIKIGAGGARANCSKTQQQWNQGSFPTAVVDVTGAGDSFNSGFLSAWKTNGGDVGDALRWGCGTASRTVAALGACSFPLAYDDVQQVVASD